MSDTTIIERLKGVETNVANIADGIEDIKQYLARSADQRVVMIEKLAVIDTKQNDMKEYQVRCDNDRKGLDKRVDNVEGFQSNQKKVVAAMAAGISFLVIGGSKVAEKVIVWFS